MKLCISIILADKMCIEITNIHNCEQEEMSSNGHKTIHFSRQSSCLSGVKCKMKIPYAVKTEHTKPRERTNCPFDKTDFFRCQSLS